jgi:hypothetical protein
MHSTDLRTRIIRTLLQFDSEVLTRKSAAAASVEVLADVTGQLCSLILKENGEAVFKECLDNIVEHIEERARRPAPVQTCADGVN